MVAQPIEHDSHGHRFILDTGGEDAVLEYRLSNGAGAGNTTVNFTRTYVPPQYRGKGRAEALVRHGLSWAKQQGYQIQASCWYVAKFLR